MLKKMGLSSAPAFGKASPSPNLLTPTTKRCPHLGCALKWNPVEHTWDCPCHGSRYDYTGRLLSGPAIQPLETNAAE